MIPFAPRHFQISPILNKQGSEYEGQVISETDMCKMQGYQTEGYNEGYLR